MFDAFTSHAILRLRSELTQHISDCVIECADSSLSQVQLTKATKTARFGWYVAETLLKVALNMATQAAGGIIIDGLHDALGTHGSSPFETNKQNVSVTTQSGDSVNVVVRREAGYGQALSEIDGSVFARQFASDLGELAMDDSYASVEEGVASKIAGWVTDSRNGKKVTHTNHVSILERVLMPLEILNLRLDIVHQLLNAVIADEMEAYFSSRDLDLRHPPQSQRIEAVVERCNVRIGKLGIHGYLTHLADMANNTVPKLSKAWFLKSIVAETLLENQTKVLTGSQYLSDGLWKFLASKKLIAVRKTIPDTNVQAQNLRFSHSKIYSSTMSGTFTSAKGTTKLRDYYDTALSCRRLTVTNKEKFGGNSTLATFLVCESFLNEDKEGQKELIRETQNTSSYRNYVLYLPDYNGLLRETQTLSDKYGVKLSVAISGSLLP